MTEAALATHNSEPPRVILQLLEKLGVPAAARLDHLDLPRSRRIQAVLLDDSIGGMLVLYPQSQLLDLARLAELTGRQLVAVKPERLERMLAKHALQRLPALPPLTSMPCIYDERLLEEESLLIESGEPGVLLEIPRDAYRTLLGKASAARFGQSLAAFGRAVPEQRLRRDAGGDRHASAHGRVRHASA